MLHIFRHGGSSPAVKYTTKLTLQSEAFSLDKKQGRHARGCSKGKNAVGDAHIVILCKNKLLKT